MSKRPTLFFVPRLCIETIQSFSAAFSPLSQPPSMATALLLLLLMLAVPMLDVSDAGWCVCRSDVSSTTLQKTLDYACGAGADCNPVLKVGACYNPNTVLAHCSYATNSYYQRNGQAQAACDFSGTAMLTSSDPGSNGCVYPATPSAAGTSSNTPRSNSPPNSVTPSTFSPTTTNTTNGILGGIGPTETSSGIDTSHGSSLRKLGRWSLLALIPTVACLTI